MINREVIFERDLSVWSGTSRETILTVELHIAPVFCKIIVEAYAVRRSLTLLAALPRRSFLYFHDGRKIGSVSNNGLAFNLNPVVGNLIPEVRTVYNILVPLAPWEVLPAGVLVVQNITRGVRVSNEVADLGVRVVLTGVL